MEGLPQDYVIQTLFTYCKRPTYRKYQGIYNAECPVCNEGGSSGRKRRLFYFTNDRYFYCFNCSRSWQEINWLQEVTNKSYHEILRETSSFEVKIDLNQKLKLEDSKKTFIVPSIPDDSIDICNIHEQGIFTEYQQELLDNALQYCKKRRLFTAINKPKSFYMSFNDKVHKNRLIIPFYSADNKIGSYQSRTLVGDEFPKYLTKYGEKCLYGENAIDIDLPYIFIFEGPIDAMFVKNGVAVGGSTTTEKQETFLKQCLGQEIIYVFDNDKNNQEMDKKIRAVMKQNKKVFVWPKELQKYKDINEVCCSLQIDEFPYKFIVQNSYTGIEALMKFKNY